MTLDLTRRRLLRCAGAGTLVGLAGCSADVTEGEVRPTAVDIHPSELDAPVEGTVTAEILVSNVGAPGDVKITVEAVNLDADPDEPERAVTARRSVVKQFDRDEQRDVTAEIEPGPLANGLLANADPAD
jgi:hypothetical protein